MSVFGLPLDLPARVVLRALDDLASIAQAARETPARLEALDARAAAMQAQLDRALSVGERVVALGERIDARGTEIVALGERIDARGSEIVDQADGLLTIGSTALEQAVVVSDRAAEVSARAGELIATLPMLERAVMLVAPLEGTVERLGRIVDRLPGSARRRAPSGAAE